MQLGTCCRPIPGDALVGHLGRGEGLVVHTADCAVGKRLIERDSDSFMQVDWAEQPSRAFETGVAVLVRSGKGVLAQIAQAVAAAEADITHIDMGEDHGGRKRRTQAAGGGARPAAPGRRDAQAAPLAGGAAGVADQALTTCARGSVAAAARDS